MFIFYQNNTYLPSIAIMMMAFVEIDLNGLMQWDASGGREPFAKTFTKMFGTLKVKFQVNRITYLL